MRALILLLLPALPLTARADASIGTDAAAHPHGPCDYERGPFELGRGDPAFSAIGTQLKSNFAQSTARRVLFNDLYGGGIHQASAVVVDRATGRQLSRVLDRAVALVEDPAGKLVGLLGFSSDDKELRLLDPTTGAIRWRHASPRGANAAAAIVDGGRLIVATWHRWATGSSLFAVDLATGAPRWDADVKQLQIAHSEYFNDVVLGLEGGVVTLRGLEAGGCYWQTFDPATGARRVAQLERK